MMATVTEKMHPFAAAKAAGRDPYKVKDLSQADFVRKGIRLADAEIPGRMPLRPQLRQRRPLPLVVPRTPVPRPTRKARRCSRGKRRRWKSTGGARIRRSNG